MTGYTTRQASEILGISPERVRSLARSGLLDPGRGPRNEYRFSFPDVILLRTMRDLLDAGIPLHRTKRVLHILRERLPEGRPLSSLHIRSDGETVVLQEEGTVWDPQSGQVHLDFSVKELADKVAPIAGRTLDQLPPTGLAANDWYHLAVTLEPVAEDQAAEAYRGALALDPGHVRSHLNLGRLLHEGGDVEAAEAHYRQALAADPDSATAAFNLGVALEDLDRVGEAVEAYRRALRSEPELTAAHYNLARLYEALGKSKEALRHLADYKRLGGQ